MNRIGPRAHSVEAIRRIARRALPEMVYDFLEGGALDEQTLQRNRQAFQEVLFKQRVLNDLRHTTTKTEIFGTELSVPLIVSPMGLQTLLHPGADLAVARSAAKAGSVFIHSPWSGCSLEETAKAAPGRTWAQVAFWEDREVTRDHVARARQLGINTLVVAGDVGVSSKRDRDIVHGTGMPPKPPLRDVVDVMLHPKWLLRWLTGPGMTWGTYKIDGRRIRMGEMDDWMTRHHTLTATWKDIEELRATWDGNIVVKGIMCAEDAEIAVSAGADAVFVSNHGGRQFDAQPATFDVLAGVADRVGDRAKVVLDGGVRRGSDVAAALIRGADVVSAGRPFAYGLAAGGVPGVERIYEIITDELTTLLKSVGAKTVEDLGDACLADSFGRAVTAHNEMAA